MFWSHFFFMARTNKPTKKTFPTSPMGEGEMCVVETPKAWSNSPAITNSHDPTPNQVTPIRCPSCSVRGWIFFKAARFWLMSPRSFVCISMNKGIKYGTVAGYNCYRIGIEGYWRAIVPIDQIQEFYALLTTHLCLPLSRIEQTPHFCVNLLWCLGCMWRCRRQSVAETLLEGWWVDLWFQDELHTLMLHYLFKTHSKGDAFQWVSIIQISTWKTYFVDGWYYNKWYEIIVRKVCLCETCQSDPMPFRH